MMDDRRIPPPHTLGLVLWVCVWVANAMLVFLSVRLLRSGAVAPGWEPAVALLPALPVVFGLGLFAVLLRRVDELRRQLLVGAFALASAVVGVLVYGWSLLEWTGAPPVPSVMVLPAQLLLWSVLLLAARLRYP